MSDFRRPSRFLLTTHRQLCATIRTRAQWDGSVKCVQWEEGERGGTAGGCRCWNALGGQNSRQTIAIVYLSVALSKLSLPIDRCGQFHLLLPQEFSQFSDKLKGTCNTLIGRLISRLANVAKNNIAVVPPLPLAACCSLPPPLHNLHNICILAQDNEASEVPKALIIGNPVLGQQSNLWLMDYYT